MMYFSDNVNVDGFSERKCIIYFSDESSIYCKLIGINKELSKLNVYLYHGQKDIQISLCDISKIDFEK